MDKDFQRELEGWTSFFHDASRNSGSYNHVLLRRLLSPNLTLRNSIARHLCSSTDFFHVLDVGSGPVSFVGRKWKDRLVNVVAVDYLADEYMKLYKKYRIIPPVVPLKGNAEELSVLFPEKFFDVVYARNSIDHCIDPVQCISEMMKVSFGVVVLEHTLNEGEREKYDGLHRWNFDLVEGRFVIKNRHRDVVFTEDMFPSCKFTSSMETEEFEGHENWLVTTILVS